jgi:hypothetical protein
VALPGTITILWHVCQNTPCGLKRKVWYFPLHRITGFEQIFFHNVNFGAKVGCMYQYLAVIFFLKIQQHLVSTWAILSKHMTTVLNCKRVHKYWTAWPTNRFSIGMHSTGFSTDLTFERFR